MKNNMIPKSLLTELALDARCVSDGQIFRVYAGEMALHKGMWLSMRIKADYGVLLLYDNQDGAIDNKAMFGAIFIIEVKNEDSKTPHLKADSSGFTLSASLTNTTFSLPNEARKLKAVVTLQEALLRLVTEPN